MERSSETYKFGKKMDEEWEKPKERTKSMDLSSQYIVAEVFAFTCIRIRSIWHVVYPKLKENSHTKKYRYGWYRSIHDKYKFYC